MDWPASHFWRELAAADPDAKVVLTVRDPRRWFASYHELRGHVGRLLTEGERQASAGTPGPFLAHVADLNRLMTSISEEAFGVPPDDRETVLDEQTAVRRFEEHTAAVRAALPPIACWCSTPPTAGRRSATSSACGPHQANRSRT